jgi:hypothetical protein
MRSMGHHKGSVNGGEEIPLRHKRERWTTKVEKEEAMKGRKDEPQRHKVELQGKRMVLRLIADEYCGGE